ncbi:MAG: NAD(P)H-hydrate dehydratase [Sphingobacteriaceae bacterium]|nr:NAD(P)H-hydrate dehydratase [Sphingobacteriaceae bacterium]
MSGYIYSAEAVREWDNYTLLEQNISSIELMNRAAAALVHHFRLAEPHPCRVLLVAGPGNNGGDAIAMARLLHEQRYPVQLYRLPAQNYSVDHQAQWELAQAASVPMISELDLFQLQHVDWVVDGLLGNGINRAAEGDFARCIALINQWELPVFSIDLPSGLPGAGAFDHHWPVIKARITACLAPYKFNLLLPPAANFVGEVVLVDIGLSKRFRHLDRLAEVIQPSAEQPLLPIRKRFSHKGSHGHALIIAGSAGYYGAALLAARACVLAGAGLTTAAIPASFQTAFSASLPEAITITTGSTFWEAALPLLPYQAIGVGMGIGQHSTSQEALLQLLRDYKGPLLLDADALNVLSSLGTTGKEAIPKGSVLSPHPKEFDRLFGIQPHWWARLERLQAAAEELQCTILLKNAYTFVASPGKPLQVNLTGNAGLAKGGSGDVLSGIITALLAQGLSAFDAARLGVWLHGTAADAALLNSSLESLTPSAVINALPAAFQQLRLTK